MIHDRLIVEKASAYRWENPDDESLPLTRCACGVEYKPWNLILSIYHDEPRDMPCCGRKLYFSNRVEIHEVKAG